MQRHAVHCGHDGRALPQVRPKALDLKDRSHVSSLRVIATPNADLERVQQGITDGAECGNGDRDDNPAGYISHQ